jgi:F-type H+-transporting ATPase subunit gamma|tara:strand:+ start:28791 stop:29708 length:918 start_codon:yes stop_codon:yes gene_type:complete
MSLKHIKNKIRSVNKTHTVTKAIEAVSAVKMRKSQERALVARPYARHALSILKRVSLSSEKDNSPLMNEREVKKTLIVVVTSDKGLAGNLNNAVLRSVASVMDKHGLSKENTGIVSVGKKGYEYFKNRGFTIERDFDNTKDSVSVEDMKEVSGLLAKLYIDGAYDKCLVFYTHFISTFEQDVRVRVVLPVNTEAVEKAVKWILPKTGKYSELQEENGNGNRAYTFEPDAKEVLDELVPHLLNVELYHALLEAKASEHSARMVAMKNASEKAEEISKDLTRKFNKERQSSITQEISEITGGMNIFS